MKLSNLAPVEDTNELTANVHSVESFGNVDGPGIRYVVSRVYVKMQILSQS